MTPTASSSMATAPAGRRPLVSFVVVARNDNYMGDYLYRLGTSVSFLASSAGRAGLTRDIEVLVVDWASERPLALDCPLTAAAKRITTFLQVTPDVVQQRFGTVRWLPTTAINAGIRRARGEFLFFTDSDCLWSESAVASLGRLLRGEVTLPQPVEQLFCYVRRYQIPWATVQRKPHVAEWERLVPLLLAGVRPENAGAACLGGFSAGQLMHRDLWEAVRGYDEALDRPWGWSDNDLMLRVSQDHSWLDVSGYGFHGLHMEHWPTPAAPVPREPAAVNPMVIRNAAVTNGKDWGLADVDIPRRPSTGPEPPPGAGCAVPLSGSAALPGWSITSEAIEFVGRLDAERELPRASLQRLAAVAQIAQADLPRTLYWFGAIDPPILMTLCRICPGVELFLANPWPEGTSDHLPFNPGELSGFLQHRAHFRGWARILQGDPDTVLHRLDASTPNAAMVELAWVGPGTPNSLVEELAHRLAPGGVILTPTTAAGDDGLRQRQKATPGCVTQTLDGAALMVTVRTAASTGALLPAQAGQPAAPAFTETARGLRRVMHLLLRHQALKPVHPEALDWNQPILVLRSAPLDQMRLLFDAITDRATTPQVHVLSHAHDETAVRACAPWPITFHAYPVPGPYRLEALPAAVLARLQDAGFGIVFYLDAGTEGHRLGEVERLLAAIRDSRMVMFRSDGGYVHGRDWRLRQLASAAFLGMIAWYHLTLDPGSPDGPALPDDVADQADAGLK